MFMIVRVCIYVPFNTTVALARTRRSIEPAVLIQSQYKAYINITVRIGLYL